MTPLTPAGPFPDWARQHRTLAQVARTEELLAKANAGRERFTHAETSELGNLLKKFYRHNPPPDEKAGAA
jgi:hypothetical protein